MTLLKLHSFGQRGRRIGTSLSRFAAALAGLGLAAAWALPVAAGDDPLPPSPAEIAPSASAPSQADQTADVLRVAARIDALIAERWSAESVVPTVPADDAEFMRRVYLDLTGKIPRVSEAREFLDDARPDKRMRLVEKLLESPAYITHESTVWRKILIPEQDSDFQIRFLLPAFEAWLHEKFEKNTSYLEIVREILTTPLSSNGGFAPQSAPSPFAFYQAKELKPENLAGATARIFLGLRIECAQCHDHPFDDWKREEFWGYAAFFAGVQRQQGAGVLGAISEFFDLQRVAIKIPDTDTLIPATFLDGKKPNFVNRKNPRQVLAEWIASPENPYLARTAVNRSWAQFFGTGLVEPVDDFSAANPPSHPELLDELSREFVSHDYDLKFLARAITLSQTYQLSSRQTHESQADPRRFARARVRGLSGEQIFDSLSVAVGYYEPPRQPYAFYGDDDPRTMFTTLFAAGNETGPDRTTSILQTLAMMNGRFTGEATSLQGSQTLGAIVEFPLMTTAERIEALYLATLSRRPRPDELARFVPYVDNAGERQAAEAAKLETPRTGAPPAGAAAAPSPDEAAAAQKQALADLFWALLNSSEFLFNH